LLEPLVVAHAGALYEGLRDERLYRFIPQDPPESPLALEARYRVLSRRRSPDGREAWLNWAVRVRGSDAYAGVLEASVGQDLSSTIAYMTFAAYQRRGFAAEGCERVIRLLFEGYGVRFVEAEIDTRNTASVALVESLGFERTATRFGADHFKGSPSDEYRYELRRPSSQGA
jgi:[ribosomal protein S5]-alanine N-acetyltransferase